MRMRVIDGCPAPATIAPYIYVVLRGERMRATSIYRGEDAKTLLHRNGKRTQAEIYADPAYRGRANPPGRSSHELRSDGVSRPGPVGRALQEWQVGVDSGTDSNADRLRLERQARRHGWTIEHPYKRGVEGHHWQFRARPRPRSVAQRLRLVAIRARLPRR